MNTREEIIKLIGEKGEISAGEMAEYLDISRQALYKHLPAMLDKKQIIKIGRPPKVFYALKEEKKEAVEIEIEPKIRKIIDKNYFLITPSGQKLEGFAGFVHWCGKQDFPILKTAEEYVDTLKKYSIYKKGGLIDGGQKMRKTFKDLYLDGVYYLDFYSVERFGKTKLGQMLLYAKQSQDKRLIKKLIDDIKPAVIKAITKFSIDGVGFIPPTVKRQTQFMGELKKRLNLPLKEVSITKIKTEIIIPQKTLNKLNDRVENAQKTFVIEEAGRYKNILLIDDAVGSGATLNEVAKKIKTKKIAEKVIGLVITGSFKGFDVISEV